ncbi:MAG: cell division topological specificity factor MinE [Anaerolineae bacterium]|nr:cell division topological specificity factor MinE [Anaerolineae bacterium]
MASFFDRIMGRREPNSAEVARERLKLVLVSDRSDLSPEKLEEMQSEIIQVIKRYLEIDEAMVHLKLERRQRKTYMVADIPLERHPQDYQIGPEAVPPESGAPAGAEVSHVPHVADTQPKKPGDVSGSTPA